MSKEIQTPAQVSPYVHVLGVDQAIEFLMTFGGSELYLSPNPRGNSRLCQLVGQDKAAALGRACAGMPKRIPTSKPWIAKVWRSKGLPVAEIARRLHVSDVAVRGWIKGTDTKPRGDDRQLPLF
ncbi:MULTISPECIES: helix-turn-helix domain-containing protein [unclassified Yoonia]|uniref:helix-turn-helix domain-containing protein n=1 Tax=unclassified Yoonia TaxID=2629118 RepID=UPI002AFE3D34|nr:MULTISPECIES: helix-turn-helix domain-containing protein [unclassified Yoonia]